MVDTTIEGNARARRLPVKPLLMLLGCLVLTLIVAILIWNFLIQPKETKQSSKVEIETRTSKILAQLDQLLSRPELTRSDKVLIHDLTHQLILVNQNLDARESEKTIRSHADSATRMADKILRLVTVISVLIAVISGYGLYSIATIEKSSKESEEKANKALSDMKAGADKAIRSAKEAEGKLQNLDVKIKGVEKLIERRADDLKLDDLLSQAEYLTMPAQAELEAFDVQITAWSLYAEIPWEVYEKLGKYFRLTDPPRPDKSILYLNKALEKNPRSAEALYNKGVSLTRLARDQTSTDLRENLLAESRDCFRRAHDLDRKNPKYTMGLGWIFHEMGNLDQAINWYDRAIDADAQKGRDYTWSVYNKVCALSQLGETAPAFALLKEIIEREGVRTFARKDADGDLLNLKNAYGLEFENLLDS